MSGAAKRRYRRWESRQQQRAAQLHAENRARILREREAMAERWTPAPADVEAAWAAALAAAGHGFGRVKQSPVPS